MTVPPIPDHRRIPPLSNFIQDLLRDKPPVMVLDMGLGSREQGFPVHDGEPLAVIGIVGDPIVPVTKPPVG
jgi:hypothetical protein